jgi:hypothetical protein
MPAKPKNPHIGSSFDDFLKCESLFNEVHAKARERAFAEQHEGVVANEAAHISPAKRAALPYGLLEGKLKVKIGFDDPLPDDLVPGVTNSITQPERSR